MQSRLLKMLRRVRLQLLNSIGKFSVALVSAIQLIIVVTKSSILDVAGDLDPLLQTLCESEKSCMEV